MISTFVWYKLYYHLRNANEMFYSALLFRQIVWQCN